MNDTWDLSILYKGFDDPAFTGDMAALDAAIRSMNDLAAQAAALPHADLVHRYVPAPHPGRLRRSGRHHRRRPRPGGVSLSAAEHPPGQQVPPVRQGGGAVRPDEHLRRFRLGKPAG